MTNKLNNNRSKAGKQVDKLQKQFTDIFNGAMDLYGISHQDLADEIEIGRGFLHNVLHNTKRTNILTLLLIKNGLNKLLKANDTKLKLKIKLSIK